MTESQGAENLLADGVPADQEYSKDYWDNVFEQLGKRPLVKMALAVLALLYGSGIYAPLIANDRPYLLEAIDKKEYSDARKGLAGVAGSLSELAAKDEATFRREREALGVETTQTYLEAARSECDGMILRIDAMLKYLPAERHGPLDELAADVEGVFASLEGGDRAAAQSAATGVVERAREIRSTYKAEDVQLESVTSLPVLESTTTTEIFFMVLWAFILGWPVWNRMVNRILLKGDRERIRENRKTKVAAVLGTSLVCAFLWSVLVGGSMTFETSYFKERLTNGDIEAERVVYPPLRMGFAETHMAEAFRPPTWKDYAEINEEGYYVRGPRVPEPDPVTGHIRDAQPVDVRYGEPETNSFLRHPLGTDQMGRDLLVRLFYGARISLAVGLISTVLLVVIGVVIGSIAGYMGGLTDILLSRLIEIVQCFPAFFLIITAVAMIPEKTLHPIYTIIFFIAIVRWTGVARLVRGEFLRLKEQEFAVAARALGLSTWRIIFRHVLPNALGPVLVAAAFSVAAGILTESAISFLGLGIKHPIPSWGSLINESRDYEHWWIQIFPGILIFVTVFCYNLVGEGIRDALDPRMKV